MDENILNNIKAHLSNGFEKDLFEEAIKNLDIHGRLRQSNFSYAIRELIREVLIRMSPDEKVRSSRWFTPYFNDDPKKITRNQRMMYAIHGGINPEYVAESLWIETEEIIKDLIEKIDKLSKYTHVTEKIFYENNKKSTSDIITEELSIFSEFLTAIHNCKEQVAETLNDRLSEHLIDEFLSSSIDDIDHLSTHHCVEEISIECVIVEQVNEKYIEIKVEGSIYVEQQYGSSADLRNDIGVVVHTDFPFVSSICIAAFQPDNFNVIDFSYHVDISSWTE